MTNITEQDRELVEYQEPTKEDLESPMFEAIWQAIKGWDVARGEGVAMGHLYSAPTGSDVKHILNAIEPHRQKARDAGYKEGLVKCSQALKDCVAATGNDLDGNGDDIEWLIRNAVHEIKDSNKESFADGAEAMRKRCADAMNQLGVDEEYSYGLTRGAQNYYRGRDTIKNIQLEEKELCTQMMLNT